MAKFNKPAPRAAITGAGAGLGKALALELDMRGYQVFGTALLDEEIAEIGELTDDRVILTRCDITEDSDVTSWSEIIHQHLQDKGLDLLVSNVGILMPGPFEIMPISTIRHNFEVDFFGALRVIQALLPMLRQARGRIVQMSSVSSCFSLPFSAPSSAAKAALDCYADALRTELHPFGVQMTTVIPASMKTMGGGKVAKLMDDVRDKMTAQQKSLYGSQFDAFAKMFNEGQADGITAIDAARMIVDVAEMDPAPAHAPIGEKAEHILQLVRDKSDNDLDKIRHAMLGLTAAGENLI